LCPLEVDVGRADSECIQDGADGTTLYIAEVAGLLEE
jgi:hypothetical protein